MVIVICYISVNMLSVNKGSFREKQTDQVLFPYIQKGGEAGRWGPHNCRLYYNNSNLIIQSIIFPKTTIQTKF